MKRRDPNDYQVQFSSGKVKRVSDLTRTELEQELCELMDMLEETEAKAVDLAEQAQKWRKYRV